MFSSIHPSMPCRVVHRVNIRLVYAATRLAREKKLSLFALNNRNARVECTNETRKNLNQKFRKSNDFNSEIPTFESRLIVCLPIKSILYMKTFTSFLCTFYTLIESHSLSAMMDRMINTLLCLRINNWIRLDRLTDGPSS